MHRTTRRFWKCLWGLPRPVHKLTRKSFDLLKANPSHSSLHFRKVGKLWSIRIGMNYRALAMEDGEDFIWLWIGAHDEYARMIGHGS